MTTEKVSKHNTQENANRVFLGVYLQPKKQFNCLRHLRTNRKCNMLLKCKCVYGIYLAI